jgi:hypothetical protein
MIAFFNVYTLSFQDTFPSSSVVVQWSELDPAKSSNSTEITVDSTITFLQIQVKGVSALSEISMKMPNGISKLF